MSSNSIDMMPSGSVPASFEFLKWTSTYEHQKPYEVFIPLASFGDKKETVPRSNLVFESRTVTVQDARGAEGDFDLNTHGFRFARHTTAVQDLRDPEQVAEKYVPEMQRWLEGLLGREEGREVRTVCFDIRARKSMDPVEFSHKTINLEDGFDALLPATHPHIDQSSTGALRRIHRHMSEEAEDLLKGRVRIINIWRPLRKVEAWPLALCDASSLEGNDLVACDIVRRRFVGETLFGRYNEKQRWYYLSDQAVDEVTMIQIYDSDAPEGATRSCMHSSFALEETGVRVRESIEMRLLVFTPA